MVELYASYMLFFINVFLTTLRMSLKHWASHSIHSGAIYWLRTAAAVFPACNRNGVL